MRVVDYWTISLTCFFIAPCLANCLIFHSNEDHNEMVPNKTQSQYSCTWYNILKEKSKVFKYAKWPSKWLTNESLVWDLIKLKKIKKLMLVFNRFYFLQAGCDCCLRFSISHVTFSEVTSVWGIIAVAILDCSLNVYACSWQKALPCQPTVLQQTVTTHKQPKA